MDQINCIEQIQRRFTQKIDGLRDKNYWERLKILNIFSLQRRRERKTILHTWKIKNSLVRNDIKLNFNDNPERRTASRAILPPMPKTSGKVLSAFEHSFGVRSAKLWNKMSSNLTILTNYTTFVNKLDKWLKLLPDEPPIKGYYHKNRNSILDIPVFLLLHYERQI